MATIYDIAARAGVSASTVSRVLSGKKTNEQNYERVMIAAQALGYHRTVEPPRIAPQKNILLIPGRNGMEGFYAAARELGYSIQLVFNRENSPEYIYKQLASGASAGLIVAVESGQTLLAELSEQFPVVFVSRAPEVEGGHKVWIDLPSAAERLTGELERIGCRRVWLCGIEMPQISLTVRQVRAYCAENSSIEEMKTVDIKDTFFSQSMADHVSLVEEIFALPDDQRPDALMVGNSVVASCLVNLFRIRGMRVPEDIAVVSMLGGEHDLACEPYLTSVLIPGYEIGYEAVRVLDHLISGHPVPEMVTYPYKIHYGGSTRKELGSFGELIEG